MMNENRLNRVKKMEESLNRLSDWLADDKPLNESVEEDHALLDKYYSGYWREDFEADEKGEFPEDLQRGVLSEDALYNALMEYDERIKNQKAEPFKQKNRKGNRQRMKNVLFIVGSFRKKSFNMQLAHRAAALLEEQGINTEFLEYRDVPFVDQDIEYPVPEAVARIRGEADRADAIWFITPEYNHSFSGVIKNVIDWLSRPADPLDRKSASVLAGKKAVISGAAGSDAAIDARLSMAALAKAVKMELIGGEGMGAALDKEAFISDELKLNAEDEAGLRELAGLLMDQL